MLKKILKINFTFLGASSIFALAPVLLGGLPAQAQNNVVVDGRLEEYGVGTAPTLASGDTGDAVRDLQIFLDELGYYDNSYGITGTYDENTAAAVTAFESDYGLDTDGIVESDTWNSLFGIDEDSVFEEEDEYSEAEGYYDYEDGLF
jgi:peptidoglycan hydrolase-like protein with peptidoglycan-binding domain